MNGAILNEAALLINGERAQAYGPASEGMERIAAMWGAYLGRRISGHDVCCLMCLLKLARQAHGHKHDNLLDACGYLGLAADMAEDCNEDRN